MKYPIHEDQKRNMGFLDECCVLSALESPLLTGTASWTATSFDDILFGRLSFLAEEIAEKG